MALGAVSQAHPRLPACWPSLSTQLGGPESPGWEAWLGLTHIVGFSPCVPGSWAEEALIHGKASLEVSSCWALRPTGSGLVWVQLLQLGIRKYPDPWHNLKSPRVWDLPPKPCPGPCSPAQPHSLNGVQPGFLFCKW